MGIDFGFDLVSYTGICMHNWSNQWMESEHDMSYWRELPLEVLLHGVVAADDDVWHFDVFSTKEYKYYQWPLSSLSVAES